MNSVLSGVALMLLIAVIAGMGLNAQFSRPSSDVYLSPNGSVRLGE